MKFQSKPIEIEATRFEKDGDHPSVVKTEGPQGRFEVRGHQGYSTVNLGDWIIAEPDGDGFYPCDPVTFERKYEPVNA